MEPQPSTSQELQGPGGPSYTFSLTAQACLKALQLAAWIEAMVLAHRAAHPEGAGSWGWFLARCALFTFGAYVAISILVGISRRRYATGWGPGMQGRQEPQEVPSPVQPFFDATAFAATAAALLFHVGSPLWMWIFV